MAKKAPKLKREALHFCNWGGMFAHPEEQAEVFVLLPGWRQRQIHYRRKCIEAGHLPTLAELQRAAWGDPLEEIEVSFSPLLTARQLQLHVIGEEPDSDLLDQLKDAITEDSILAECTAFGQGQRLALDKPRHGLFAYLWMTARIQMGLEPTLPVTYLWELEEGIAEITGRIVCLRAGRSEAVLSWLAEQTVFLRNNVSA